MVVQQFCFEQRQSASPIERQAIKPFISLGRLTNKAALKRKEFRRRYDDVEHDKIYGDGGPRCGPRICSHASVGLRCVRLCRLRLRWLRLWLPQVWGPRRITVHPFTSFLTLPVASTGVFSPPSMSVFGN